MKKFFKNFGFTLFELLAVLAIMAIIAGIAVPKVMQTIKNARIEALESNMQLIANAVQRYVVEEELTDCIGGMFIIHPTVAESEIDAAGDADVISFSDAGVLGDDNDDVDTGATANDIALEYLATDDYVASSYTENVTALNNNYIEGGIPNYIRVKVYIPNVAGVPGTGQIEVTYGNVDSDPTDDDIDTSLLLNGILGTELSEDELIKTFSLDSGTGHTHTR